MAQTVPTLRDELSDGSQHHSRRDQSCRRDQQKRSAVGVIVTSAAGVVTVKSTIAGAITLAKLLTNFTWRPEQSLAPDQRLCFAGHDRRLRQFRLSCSGTSPAVYWSYNTSTVTAINAQVSDVAGPVERTSDRSNERSSTTAYLVILLRWKPGRNIGGRAGNARHSVYYGANYVTLQGRQRVPAHAESWGRLT